VIALVQKAVSDHKPAIAATFRLIVQKMFAILPCAHTPAETVFNILKVISFILHLH
jgi:hypothetical protein